MERTRAIGPLGALARVVIGLGLLGLAWRSFNAGWNDVALGLGAFPAVVLLVQWLWLRHTSAPRCARCPLAHCVNCGIATALVLIPFTADATAVFAGASMLLAAARGDASCEVLAISNTVLGRRDKVACPVFAPLDALEARTTRRANTAIHPSGGG